VTDRRRGPAKLGDALAEMLAGSSLGARIARAEVLGHWASAVGPQIAAVTQARAIAENGTLTVGVKTSAWLQELSMMERTLVAKVNKTAGGDVVRRIRWELLR
jgi:predicted nucleic acid-binding Zn ribbon protein